MRRFSPIYGRIPEGYDFVRRVKNPRKPKQIDMNDPEIVKMSKIPDIQPEKKSP